MTTYGQLLDAATAALSAAADASRAAPPPDVADKLVLTVLRARLYDNLRQQVLLVGPHRYGGVLTVELRQAAARSLGALNLQPPTTVRSPVTRALDDAVRAADAALRILDDHLRPETSADTRVLPVAPEAVALQERGTGGGAALRHIGEVVTAAMLLDRELERWLATPQIVAAAIADVHHTVTGRLAATARKVMQDPQPSPLDALRVRTVEPDPANRSTRTTVERALDNIDDARRWLLRHRDSHTAADLHTLARVGLALSFQTAYMLRLAGRRLPEDVTRHLTSGWRRVNRRFDHVRDVRNVAASPPMRALIRTERWLRGLSRTETGWRPPEQLARTPADREFWYQLGIALAARLPDLATLLAHGIEAALHGNTLVQLWWPGPREVHGRWVTHPLWERASTVHGPGRELLHAVRDLRTVSELPAIITDTVPTAGLPAILDRKHLRTRTPGRYLTIDRVDRRLRGVVEDAYELRAEVRAKRAHTRSPVTWVALPPPQVVGPLLAAEYLDGADDSLVRGGGADLPLG